MEKSAQQCVTMRKSKNASEQTTADRHGERENLTRILSSQHGPLLGGAELVRVLGYRTSAAFRQAHKRGQISVPVFKLPDRRGYYALTHEVAEWIAEARFPTPAQPQSVREVPVT